MAPELQAVDQEGRVRHRLDPGSPLAVSGLTVAYDRKPALWNIDFEAPAGRLIAIVGPNGAGKSTFLKAALGLVPKLAGEVRFFGEPLSKARRRVAYVPQRSSIDWDFPTTAGDVVAMGLYGEIGWLRPVRRRHREKARELLDRVGMADFAERQIGQLSGGQQQRVFLARALAQDSELTLMDEPFAGVDAATETALVTVLRELRELGRTVIVVHHDLESAPRYFDHALILNRRVVAAGPIPEVWRPEILQRAYGGRLAPSELIAATGQGA